MKKLWCPVKKIYLKRVNLAKNKFNNNPTIKIDIVSTPKIFCATLVTASLFGTTPVIPNPCSINVARGAKLAWITPAPAANIKYPKIGPNVPVNTLCPGVFKASKPTNAINPIKNAGSLKIFWKNINTPFMLLPPYLSH